ncbi:hypothetical protein CHU98_g2376 [Xylaria longipes]|nr:hypothetical protein CHU98_g2376 [Xylaria longipes]
MTSQPERAYTCKLPSRKGAPFIELNCPDWSKLDIIGQTIILAELTPRLGSFQNACAALSLQSNEVDSFVSTHVEYQQASERGKLIAEKWGRDQAVPADDDADIPQQRPVLVSVSSIVPACNFLEALGHQEHIQAVRAWSRRHITWPPYIDVTHLDTSKLNQADIDFPVPRKQEAYSRYTGSLGNDGRAMVGFVSAWQPKEDGIPDTRISFINVPDGSVAFGPRGSRELINPGRYSVCWRVGSLSDNEYNDFVLARNTSDGRENSNNFDLHEGLDAGLETLNTDEESAMADTTLPENLTVNPKAIFGPRMPDTYNREDGHVGPFHPQHEPQGPSRELANPQLQQTWSNWSGQIFQFRLHRGYTILGPLGHILTFDPPQHERYDEMGNPHGVGGTYFIVPFQKTSRGMSFKMDELPANVPFRLKITEKLVLIRNGMVLPRFVEPGVHEWSTQEGRLDLYNERGCYDIPHTVGCYNILPEFDRDEQVHIEEHREHSQNVAGNLSPIGEAVKTLAPHRDWLNRQEAKSKRLERETKERARLDARNAREKARRDILIEERESRQQALEVQKAQEKARLNATGLEDTAVAQRVKNRGGRRTQSSNGQFDPNLSALPAVNSQPGDTKQQKRQSIDSANIAPPDASVKNKATPRRGRPASATRRKCADDDEDEDYKPTTSRPARARKPRSAQKATTPRKSQAQPADDVSGAGNPQLAPVPQNRRTRATTSQSQVEKRGAGSADAGIVPKVNDGETTTGAANDSDGIGEDTMNPGMRTAKPTTVSQELSDHDSDENECEVDD